MIIIILSSGLALLEIIVLTIGVKKLVLCLVRQFKMKTHFFYKNTIIFGEPQYFFSDLSLNILKYSYYRRIALLLTVSEKFHTRNFKQNET